MNCAYIQSSVQNRCKSSQGKDCIRGRKNLTIGKSKLKKKNHLFIFKYCIKIIILVLLLLKTYFGMIKIDFLITVETTKINH